MIELGVGVLFAVMFVAAYLFVSNLHRKGGRGRNLWRELFRDDTDAARSIGENRPRLFLTTDEMSEHHSQARKGGVK